MNRVIIIGCGKTKAETPQEARTLYTGRLFRARLTYAEARRPYRVLIMSALWGLIELDRFTAPYDHTMSHMTPDMRVRLGRESMEALIAKAGLPCVVEIHAGQEYVNALLWPDIARRGVKYEVPLRGLGIGQQLAWYRADREQRIAANDASIP